MVKHALWLLLLASGAVTFYQLALIEAGNDSVVMETTSHGLALERTRNCRFAVGVVTNQSGIASGRITREQADRMEPRELVNLIFRPGFSTAGEVTAAHIGNTRKAARPNGRYVLAKPGDGRKIDLAVCSVIAHEAAGDVTAAKLWRKRYRAYSA